MINMQMDTFQAVENVARKILQFANEHDHSEAIVIALHGDLGAGKTTLVQTLARELGVTDIVTSPTFVIMKQYELEDDTGAQMAMPFAHLYHIDAYRIENIDEMRVLSFAELLQQKDTIICIEWAERIEELLPENTIDVVITLDGEKRSVTLS